MKKKGLCLLLAVVLIFSVLPLSAIAEGVIPTIVLGGYTSPQIYLFDDEGNIIEKVWMLNLDNVLNVVKKDIPDITKANFNTVINRDPSYAGQQISDAVAEIAKYMRRNPDGSLPYNTGTWPRSAEESNMAYINAHRAENPYLETAVKEKRLTPLLCEMRGEENVYCFSVDWRQNIIECARDLGKFIVDVRRHSGSKKVNIFCESHGGEDTSFYICLSSIVAKGGGDAERLGELLNMSQKELNQTFNLGYLNNVVLDNPAIGVQIMYDILMGKVHFDAPRLIEYLQYANNPLASVNGGAEYVWESNLEWFFNRLTLDNINRLFNALIQNYDIINILYSFGSAWDFIPLRLYDTVKDAKLNTPEMREKYAVLIEKSDFAHYTVMAHMHEYLTFAREKGVKVNIICGTDLPAVTGSRISSDGLVAAQDASGAKTTDYGTRFSDGYRTDYTDKAVTCTDKTHDHVAPRMNLDGAYGYLPENTWFIDEQYHAQYIEDQYCTDLVLWLLYTDKNPDIYTDPAFPQFEITHNGKFGLHACFNTSPFGTITKNDTALTVTNLSNKSNLELISIKVEGADFSFADVYGKKIPRGKSVSLSLKGNIPDADMKNVRLSFYYLEDNTLFSMDSRSIFFNIKGGKNTFDKTKPITTTTERPIYLTMSDITTGMKQFDARAYLKAILIAQVVYVRYLFNALKTGFNKIKR
ncbi:MAG: hypothetical protein IJU56_07995 [Clostridia bacterium]|nr:hypothetical protein [Clostridia bacterium]